MGCLLQSKTRFEYPGPGPDAIARAASRISGLEVGVIPDEPREYREYEARLFFRDWPEHTVNIFTFKQGVIKQLEEEEEKRTGYRSPMRCLGHDDVDGVQHIYVNSYTDTERTLFDVVTESIRQLDGTLENYEPDPEPTWVGLTAESLKARHEAFRQKQRKRLPGRIACGVLMLLGSPFWFLWMLLRFPFDLFRIYREDPDLFKSRKH